MTDNADIETPETTALEDAAGNIQSDDALEAASDKPRSFDGLSIEGALEALLFVSDEPVSGGALAKILDTNPSDVDRVLADLATRFEEEERGIQLREVAGGWRLYSHPAYHDVIENYVISWDTRSLSQAALEVLAVVAYHQPATRATINGVRGVNSEGVISSLVEKGLVREAGRDDAPGNPILYATTRTFLEKFGLRSLRELPPLEDFAPDEESREFIRERLSAREPSPEQLELVDDDGALSDKDADALADTYLHQSGYEPDTIEQIETVD